MTTTAEHWDKLAREHREWGAYEASRGHYAGVFEAKARLCERAAKSIRLGEETGVPHCVCHLIPVAEAIRLYDKPLGGRR